MQISKKARKSNQFPREVKFGEGGSTRWRLSDLMRWEAQRAGEHLPDDWRLPPADERFLSDLDVAKRYGISRPTVWRWRSDSIGDQPDADAA